MEDEKDHIAIRRIQDGDTAACRDIVERYGDRIFALLTGIAGNRMDAEELASDVFLKAFDSLHRFRGECKFSTWLYRIAYNTAVSHTRRKKPHTVAIDERLPDIPDDTQEALLKEAQLRSLEKALTRLTPDERALTELFYMQKVPVHDISAVTGDTEGNLKVKLFRIRKKLADIIANEQ